MIYPSNPYPSHRPDDEWDAWIRFHLEQDPALKSDYEKKWKEIKSRYVLDKNLAYIKDDRGRFKKDHSLKPNIPCQ